MVSVTTIDKLHEELIITGVTICSCRKGNVTITEEKGK